MPTVEEVNDVAPALQASRSGPRDAAVRVPDISGIKKRLERVMRRDWSDANMQDFDDHVRADMARLIAIIEADRSERAQPEANTNMEGE